jgi:HSP20 family protein
MQLFERRIAMAGTLAPKESTTVHPWFRRGPLANLRSDLEDLLSNLVMDAGDGWLTSHLAPSLDVSETDSAVEVRMDVPGMKPDDIDIQLSGNTLRVSGERKEEKEEKGRTFHRAERRSGSFSRVVTLPCNVKDDKIDAQYHDGVLTISMPKCEEAKARKIKVKA